MVQAIGFLGKMGAVAESVYGTEVAVAQMLQMISESLVDQPQLIRSNVLDGRPDTRQSDQGNIAIGGDLAIRMRYQLANTLMLNWFGQLSAGAFTALGTTEGKSMTLAIDKKVSVWTYTGVKCHKLVIAGSPEGIMMTASVYATALSKTSVVNTATVLAGLIDPSNNIMFHHCVIRLADHVDALATGDKIKVTNFTITLERPLDQVFVNEQRGVLEPFENNFRNIQIAFTVPRYNAEQYHSWKDANTRLQMDFVFTDPNSSRTKTLVFPNVQLDTVGSPIAGPASLPVNVTAVAMESEDTLTTTQMSAAASDNSYNISSASDAAATGTLTLTGAVNDGETVTINGDVYEIDTQAGGLASQITAGRIQVDLSGGSTVRAAGTLSLPTQPTAGDTMTIDGKVYTFDVNGGLVNTNGHIEIGSSLGNTQTNIRNAINLTGTPGTGYASVMTQHTSVTMAAFGSNAAVITANKGGTPGNSIATTETFTAGGNVFDAATLGTTTAGVSPPAAEAVTALVSVINASGTAEVGAVDGAGNTVVVTAEVAGTEGNSIATTETLANGSWGGATLSGGTGTVAVFPYCTVGAQVYVGGFTTAGNNGTGTVVSRTDHKVVVSGLTLTDEAVGDTVTFTTRSPDVLASET